MSTSAISPGEPGANRPVQSLPEMSIFSKPLDANSYATKKTIAQGMLDIALLTANASQLKYVLQVGEKHEFYSLMVALISVSIILQVGVGIIFLVVGGLNINRQVDQRAALILNDLSLVLVFVISLINVIISGFGMEHSSQPLKLVSENVVIGIINVTLGSAFNINKQQHQRVANAWNNVVLALNIVTTALNVVISAFDMRQTGGGPIGRFFNTSTTTPSGALAA